MTFKNIFKKTKPKNVNKVIHKPLCLVVPQTGDTDGSERPISFLANTLKLYSLPGKMLMTVNLLLNKRSTTVRHVCLTESRFITM